jgi:hypothetical protein
LRVEDSANPDTTPFIINNAGLVGVGTTTPNERLTVSGNISASNAVYVGNGLTVTGDIVGDNLRVSFNQGIAVGDYSFAEGGDIFEIPTLAVSDFSHAEGGRTVTGKLVTFETFTTDGVNYSIFTFAPGVTANFNDVTTGTKLVGYNDLVSDYYIFNVIARSTITGTITGDSGFGFNEPTTLGNEGWLYAKTAPWSHAEGNTTRASGIASHSEGNGTTASGNYSHAEGSATTASGNNSHAEGVDTQAIGSNSHAEGYETIAEGNNSHAEGTNTSAIGGSSHAEGFQTIAEGDYSHAAGRGARAAHDYTYIWTDSNEGSAPDYISTTRTGQYMVSASGGVFIPGSVGIGTDSVANALTVVGNMSASNITYARGGNSNQWNSTFTTVQSNSASWGTGGGGGVTEEFVVAMSIGLS